MTGHEDLDEALKKAFTSLGRSQQQVARLILEDATLVALLSAGELAERAGVHAATVVRLAQKLGYEGYLDFQKSLRSRLSQYPMFLQQMERSGVATDADALVTRSFAHARRNLEQAARTVDRAALESLVDQLTRCQRVIVLGIGVARPVAAYLASCLQLVGLQVYEPVDSVAIAQQFALVDERDVVIVIDFHRYYRDTIRLAAAAHASGSVVATITDSAVSALAPHTDLLLVVPSEGPTPRTSLAPAMVLVEAVLALLTVHDRPRATGIMRKIDETYRQMGIFSAS